MSLLALHHSLYPPVSPTSLLQFYQSFYSPYLSSVTHPYSFSLNLQLFIFPFLFLFTCSSFPPSLSLPPSLSSLFLLFVSLFSYTSLKVSLFLPVSLFPSPSLSSLFPQSLSSANPSPLGAAESPGNGSFRKRHIANRQEVILVESG